MERRLEAGRPAGGSGSNLAWCDDGGFGLGRSPRSTEMWAALNAEEGLVRQGDRERELEIIPGFCLGACDCHSIESSGS